MMRAGPERLLPLPVLLSSFLALYLWNVAPEVTWEDSALYHRIVQSSETPWGSAETHRLYFLCLKAAAGVPVGTLPWRLNAFHALLSVLCLFAIHRLVTTLSGSRFAGHFAVVALGLSHLFWHYAEVTKAYPLMNLLLLSSWWALAEGVDRGRSHALWAGGLAGGLALSTHPFAAVAIPGALAWIASAPTGRLRKLAGWLGGFLPTMLLLGLLYSDKVATQGLWGSFYHWAFGGQGAQGPVQGADLLSVDFQRLPLDACEWAAFLGYQFGFALVFAWRGIRESLRLRAPAGRGLLVLYAAYVAVPFDFNVPLKINFYLPSFLLVAVWCGWGAAALPPRRHLPTLALAGLLPVCLYAATVFGPLKLVRENRLHRESDRAYKDRGRFYLWPPKRGFDEPRRYAARAFGILEPGAAAIADLQEADVLRYYQREMNRPDCAIHHVSPWLGPERFRAWARRDAAGRPLYVGRVYRPLWQGSDWKGTPAGDFDRIAFPEGER